MLYAAVLKVEQKNEKEREGRKTKGAKKRDESQRGRDDQEATS